jgi:flagellar biosynthesis/type III secretory pathway protein FliH
MIIKKKNKKTELGIDNNNIIEKQSDELENVEQKQEEQEIDLFDLDNIDFKQRQERRRGDRRRGFRRIDDRNLISRAREEADAIKQSAAKEGYQEGLNAAKADIEKIRESIEVFYNAKQEVYENIAPDILEISFDIAKKIIKKESIENPEIILENIKDIMKGLSKEESKITLRVAPSQVSITKQKVPEVASSLGLEVKISVIADESVMEGGCVLTTTNGVIDATIESQLEIISEVLKDI